MDEKKNEIILFENQGVKLEVNLKDETVWLNRQQLADLFDRDVKTIGKHINNALKEELKDVPTVAKFATVQKEGERKVSRNIEYYNLDMILSIGYRVKSNKGIIFRQWANKILKDYMLKGYAINQKRLDYLEKTIKLIDIANRIDENLKLIKYEKEFDATEWDKTAAPEDLFIWKSNDPNNSEYGTVIGYRKNILNYTILKYPTRCTKIEASYYEEDQETVRSFTKNILKVEMPNTITEIGTGEFSVRYYWNHGFYFNSLEKIELSKSLESIPSYTFCGCEKLKNIEIPNSVTSIGDSAFEYCTGLTDVKIPDSVTSIGDSVFKYCTGLTKIPDSVTSIGDSAFAGCTGLTKIPDSVTSIGDWAFYDCTGLTDVKIPDSVTSIEDRAFENVAHITYAGSATGSPWGAKSYNK